MKKRIVKRYSEAFRRQVVCEYEDGCSVQDLRCKYGIKGHGTIQGWVRKYGNASLRHELVIVQRADERERETELETRVRELEGAVTCSGKLSLLIEFVEDNIDHETMTNIKETAIAFLLNE